MTGATDLSLQIFSPYGRVEDVYLMRDEMKQSRGCGFVKYSQREMAQAAINALNGTYTMRGVQASQEWMWKTKNSDKLKYIERGGVGKEESDQVLDISRFILGLFSVLASWLWDVLPLKNSIVLYMI
ncbi:UNVERIFIED_CONTAM: Flowering time control protein FCA [Sesamum radiatum]|uniref:Flowering time control protein FCA n=1 Tax=Sesamum radiatum TaxID=300843 RepID=A0AAW2UDY8_SESRA